MPFDNRVPDSGKTHYDVGLRMVKCGALLPVQFKSSDRARVECPACLKLLRGKVKRL